MPSTNIQDQPPGPKSSQDSTSAAAVQPSKRIVALVPARNEGPRIAFCLRALALYADAIVYLDDCSDDDTVATVESLAAACRVEKIIRKKEWLRDDRPTATPCSRRAAPLAERISSC